MDSDYGAERSTSNAVSMRHGSLVTPQTGTISSCFQMQALQRPLSSPPRLTGLHLQVRTGGHSRPRPKTSIKPCAGHFIIKVTLFRPVLPQVLQNYNSAWEGMLGAVVLAAAYLWGVLFTVPVIFPALLPINKSPQPFRLHLSSPTFQYFVGP